jgi:hypothetical protein
MANFAQYIPDRVVVSFLGHNVLGFMDGTFVTAEREADLWSKHIGATSDVTRVQSMNRSGSVTITLHQSSPSNDILSRFAQLDERLGATRGMLLVKDLNGRAMCQSEFSWIRKMPNLERGDEVAGVEWIIDCAFLDIQHGGA